MPNQMPDFSILADSIEYQPEPLSQLISFLNLRNSVIELSLAYLQQCKISHIECFRFDSALTEKLRPGRGNDDC
ncbi:hypothetical protein [Paenibacillus sacheonensis]|uniref:Uncharacterized protein n=1 Tax=Paenibacillus sacheonensis TaxID=742054 RepID=A0A7X4YNE2_9BACL|nr:hypothetical protein [Paenibacillus sacheonensis]MBM7565508.1 hypothetical protein [Paenibacillus sacheonensis]NBC69568.1 hypothetical protein [Paenibacillus sacheonensis]